MIDRRHIEQLDDAVRVARTAVTTQHVADADRLSHVLHERWYLGLASQHTEVPARRRPRLAGVGPPLDRSSAPPAATWSGCT